ncbi:tetratricopeptide repeat protein [Buchnera aphidicola]|uniref:tetratricopeptide repeat protein n=1 Tax=Buchnera aphidicola TaxID=9 RepID=UPI00094CC80D|nr:tetratricopeptide repeat protein [Buchnera aphidicola]
MKYKTYFDFFNRYKKYFFITFFLFFLSLLICTLIIYKKSLKKKEQMITEFKNIISAPDNKKLFPIKKQKCFFKKQNSIFNSLIGINLAKRYFLKKNYKESVKTIRKILLSISDENLRCFMELNLVKIFIKNKQFSSALNIINNVKNNDWKPIFQSYKKQCIL